MFADWWRRRRKRRAWESLEFRSSFTPLSSSPALLHHPPLPLPLAFPLTISFFFYSILSFIHSGENEVAVDKRFSCIPVFKFADKYTIDHYSGVI